MASWARATLYWLNWTHSWGVEELQAKGLKCRCKILNEKNKLPLCMIFLLFHPHPKITPMVYE